MAQADPGSSALGSRGQTPRPANTAPQEDRLRCGAQHSLKPSPELSGPQPTPVRAVLTRTPTHRTNTHILTTGCCSRCVGCPGDGSSAQPARPAVPEDTPGRLPSPVPHFILTGSQAPAHPHTLTCSHPPTHTPTNTHPLEHAWSYPPTHLGMCVQACTSALTPTHVHAHTYITLTCTFLHSNHLQQGELEMSILSTGTFLRAIAC